MSSMMSTSTNKQFHVCVGTQTLNKLRRGRKRLGVRGLRVSLNRFHVGATGNGKLFRLRASQLSRLSCGTSGLSRRSPSAPARVSDAANGAMKLQQCSLAALRMPSTSLRLLGAFTRPLAWLLPALPQRYCQLLPPHQRNC